MHKALVEATVERVRQRASEGDCPVTPAYSVEWLENTVLALALTTTPLAGEVWRPIETAPKDGSELWMWNPVHQIIVRNVRWVVEAERNGLTMDGWKLPDSGNNGNMPESQWSHWTHPQPDRGPGVSQAPTPSNIGDAEAREALEKARFLVARIDELDWCGTFEDFVREWNGHVDPPLCRLRSALTARTALQSHRGDA